MHAAARRGLAWPADVNGRVWRTAAGVFTACAGRLNRQTRPLTPPCLTRCLQGGEKLRAIRRLFTR